MADKHRETPDILGAVLSGELQPAVQLRWDYSQAGENAAAVQKHAVNIKRHEAKATTEIIAAGEDFIAVKALLGHGQWLDWLDVEFRMTDRTARRIMSITDAFGGKTDNLSDLNTSVLYMIAADSTPEPARQAVIDASANGQRVTVAQAKEIIAEYKPRTVTPPTARAAYHEYQVNGAALPAWVEDGEEGPVNIEDQWGSVETVGQPEPPRVELTWTPSELERRGFVENGQTVHANMKTDLALIEWAKTQWLFVRVDRASEWGNPFLLPADGDRLTVVENYQWYLDRKPSLLAKLPTLKGKVLGCWCYPEMCHAEVLGEYADDTAD